MALMVPVANIAYYVLAEQGKQMQCRVNKIWFD